LDRDCSCKNLQSHRGAEGVVFDFREHLTDRCSTNARRPVRNGRNRPADEGLATQNLPALLGTRTRQTLYSNLRAPCRFLVNEPNASLLQAARLIVETIRVYSITRSIESFGESPALWY
jgi:hypothetical protein